MRHLPFEAPYGLMYCDPAAQHDSVYSAFVCLLLQALRTAYRCHHTVARSVSAPTQDSASLSEDPGPRAVLSFLGAMGWEESGTCRKGVVIIVVRPEGGNLRMRSRGGGGV